MIQSAQILRWVLSHPEERLSELFRRLVFLDDVVALAIVEGLICDEINRSRSKHGYSEV